MQPLVSIVTPCYNGAAYLERYFSSILNQTYKKLELIFVNDGSTDDTEQIALSYKEALEKQGIKFVYLFQENGGQAKALNTGLKEVTGEFLIWPDSDDVMTSESIEKRVAFLIKNPELAWVRSNAHAMDDASGKFLWSFARETEKCNKDIFLDLILEQTYCCCGCYMLRVNALREIYPDMQIYVGSQGQNWQILIPMAAKHICGYIDEPLYLYMIRNNSHSHQERSLKERLERYDGLEDILRHSLKAANRHDRDYDRILYIKRLRFHLYLYLEVQELSMADVYYRKLRQERELQHGDKERYLSIRHPQKYKCFLIKNKCVRAVKKVLRCWRKPEKT